MQNTKLIITGFLALIFSCPFMLASQITNQTEGLPYTRSTFSTATKALKGYMAFFSGSRYAFVNGKKIRLSQNDLLRGEAFTENGKFFVPTSFAGVLTMKQITPDPIPAGLEILGDRWVYKLYVAEVPIPENIEQMLVGGEKYFAINDLAKQIGKRVYLDQTGLLLLSDKPVSYTGKDQKLADCITSVFDTPEKYMNPDLATQNIPWLKTQKKWTEHAKVTPEQLTNLENSAEKYGILFLKATTIIADLTLNYWVQKCRLRASIRVSSLVRRIFPCCNNRSNRTIRP